MKKILGLDLGTNSIGWAVVQTKQTGDGLDMFDKILNANSRIIPMDQATIGDFNKGNSKSQTAERTRLRGVRRLLERSHLRRERLNRVLSVMGWLPEHYAQSLDEYGKFLPGVEPKLPWTKTYDGQTLFLFDDSFHEMLEDFKRHKPDAVKDGRKIPYDWTLYYLRKKALTEPVSKYELAWILLSFNQKRGYYQLRGEEEDDNTSKNKEYKRLMVKDVVDTGEKKGKGTWFNIVLENDWVYRRTFNDAPDWKGKYKDFIVTTDLDKNGNPKTDNEGNVKRSLRIPNDDDWTLLKQKTEYDIDSSQKTVGEFIYDSLLSSPDVKVRGKLVRTIERKYYRKELEQILETQMKFNPDLQSDDLYSKCILALYPNNEAYRNSISNRGFQYLFINDILFYQRPLKSKKSLIDDCPLEERIYVDPKTNEKKISHLKCTAKSNPYFQEFRLWQFLVNLRIYERERKTEDGLKENVDVTSEFLPDYKAIEGLFSWLNDRETIEQKDLLLYPGFGLDKKSKEKYRWNYVEDKSYPANQTRGAMLKSLKKAGVSVDFLTFDIEYSLWHILYSVEDPTEIKQALQTFAQRYGLSEDFVAVFSKQKPYDKDYAAYSEKAIKRLLPLMCVGKYWSEDFLDAATRSRIDKLLDGEYDEKIRERVRQKTINLRSVSDFQGLPLWLASYIVYDRHSESKDIAKWASPSDMDAYIKGFKQHSLRNPIVESIVLETLRTVRDIWKSEGTIDEIHIELGREMKNPKDKRKKITEQVLKNENTNLRIRAMLTEFINPEFDIENVRPNSPSQQEILRIYEGAVLEAEDQLPDDISEILKKFDNAEVKKRPTSSEVLRYKIWLEQKYRSPYTGQPIPLGKLFTPEYEIEHIIPQSVYFDDSYNNKVICEAEVNKLKGNLLGYQFIKEHNNEVVTLNGGRTVKILSVQDYEEFVKKNYSNRESSAKRRNLLADEIPEGFIQRQLNDSRYISKVVKSLLSNIVRENNEEEDISKNVIVCSGGVTDRLKKDWGINDIWKEVVMPRFERLDSKQNESYTAINANGKKVPIVPLSHQKGFEIKRIDHRHHTMDAIVIACATRNIINYLNNSSACRDAKIKRFDLQRLVCEKKHQDDKGNYKWVVKMPATDFVRQVKVALDNCIVSFKQNLRVINKSSNKYEKIIDGKKVMVRQVKGDNWSIRKPMHRDTVYGEINLRQVKSVSLKDALQKPERIVDKEIKRLMIESGDIRNMKAVLADKYPDMKRLDVYYYSSETKDRYFATRVSLSPDFKKDMIEKCVADSGIRKILLRHLEQCGNDSEIAFSPDGIDKMNKHIAELNDGRFHQPIYKVRKYEKADKFAIGELGAKSAKFVEAAKGTNLFFGIYVSEDGVRSYASIPLIDVINREKEGLSPVPEVRSDNNDRLLFYLSPNDLVYLPTPEEIERGYVDEGQLERSRIYKMVSCNSCQCFFIPYTVAKTIVDKVEFSSSNKMEKAVTGEMIKSLCIPIKVDRLGNIVNFNGKLI